MTYYANINSRNKLQSISIGTMITDEYGSSDVQNIEVSEEVYNNAQTYGSNYYKYDNGEIVSNPDYEQEQAAKERERIGQLQVTKRVFALGLQQLGITYSQLKELIATSEQAQLEWDLCVELLRGNPLLDIMCGQLGITPAQIDYIFQKANGEVE